MDTIDKIVEELKDFTISVIFCENSQLLKDMPVNSERGILDAKNSQGVEISNWLRKKLTEAERKGKEKAYQYIGTLSKLRMAMFNSINKKEKAKAFEQTWRDCLNEYKKLKELEKK